MPTIQWVLDADSAMEFYRRKEELEGVTGQKCTEEACGVLLFQMAKEGLVKSVMATERSKEQVIQDLAKNYGKVLHLKGENNADKKHS